MSAGRLAAACVYPQSYTWTTRSVKQLSAPHIHSVNIQSLPHNMSVDFGPIPFPDSPIQDYFQRRISGSTGSSGLSAVSSPVSPPAIDEKLLETRLLAYIDNQKATHENLYSDKIDAMERLESQVPEKTVAPPPEYRVPLARKLFFLGLYFLLNISLTLSNKEILIEVSSLGKSNDLSTDFTSYQHHGP